MKEPLCYRGYEIELISSSEVPSYRWYSVRGQGNQLAVRADRPNALQLLLTKIDDREDAPKMCPSGYGGECYFVRGHFEDGLQTDTSYCCYCGRAYIEPLKPRKE